jgi:hypothetical protein
MSLSVSWRSCVIGTGALAAVVAGGLAVSVLPAADAQQPPLTATGVASNILVSVTNGNSNLPEFSGSGDGVVGVACTGANPRTGPNIPAQVITTLRTDLTYLRILHNTGTPLTGDARINCVLEVEATPQGSATLQRLQHAD